MTSRDLSDSTVEPHLTGPRKKLQRPKLKKSQTAPWKWYFSPHDFLGLQQSLCNINFFIWYFYEQISKKKFAKMYHGDYRISQSGRFWWHLFERIFSHSKSDFWLKPTIPETFYIFWRWDEQKDFAIIFDGFDTWKKRFRLVSHFFRAQLYLTKVSPT